MKTIVLILCMAMSTLGFAFDNNKTGTALQEGQQEPKMIKKETLPKVIIDAFETGDYKEWAIDNAYSVTTTRDGDKKADYLITAKKEDPTSGIYEEAVFYFNKKGKMVKKDKIDKDWPGNEDEPQIN